MFQSRGCEENNYITYVYMFGITVSFSNQYQISCSVLENNADRINKHFLA